jgi:hypothetical protein
MKTSSVILSIIFFTSILVSCKKEKDKNEETGSFTLAIESFWEPEAVEKPFYLSTNFVQTHTGDTLNLEVFSYYLSNVRLKRADGSWWSETDSYYLIESDNDGQLVINNVPLGEYTAIDYVLGVDSTRNVSGAQGGDLAPSLGMFWSWNTGYIFIKAEGTSPNLEAPNQSFAFHLAGFTGQYAIVTKREFDFGSETLTIKKDSQAKVKFKNYIGSLWNSAQSVTISSNIQATGSKSKSMALDFYNSFSYLGIEN